MTQIPAIALEAFVVCSHTKDAMHLPKAGALRHRAVGIDMLQMLQGWEDLKRRLAPNRRLFGFFHPSLPAEPLVLLHTALTCEVPAAMKDVLEQPPGAIHSS